VPTTVVGVFSPAPFIAQPRSITLARLFSPPRRVQDPPPR
jgi:hypothetical protein